MVLRHRAFACWPRGTPRESELRTSGSGRATWRQCLLWDHPKQLMQTDQPPTSFKMPPSCLEISHTSGELLCFLPQGQFRKSKDVYEQYFFNVLPNEDRALVRLMVGHSSNLDTYWKCPGENWSWSWLSGNERTKPLRQLCLHLPGSGGVPCWTPIPIPVPSLTVSPWAISVFLSFLSELSLLTCKVGTIIPTSCDFGEDTAG